MNIFKKISLFASISLFTSSLPSLAQNTDNTEPAFRNLYKELVETNTTLSSGSCTLAAQRMAEHLISAGIPQEDVNVFFTPEHPMEGGLVAKLRGSDPHKKAILLLAHIDVVEAKREDWVRDPFTLIEENGYFYARGAFDDKAMAAIFTDLLIRYRQEGFRPKRDIKLALTCGEETSGAFNGAQWLTQNHKDWIDAEFAINEGAGGLINAEGTKVMLNVQAGEKVYQDFLIETTNPGGHSSQPVPQNAIYEMGDALKALSQYEFPLQLNDTTREYFTRFANIAGGNNGEAMRAIVANPNDENANAILSRNKAWHSILRTTCVATMIEGGHAKNALPQRVRANVNCRIFPGNSVESVREALANAINNPNVDITIKEPRSLATPTPSLSPQIIEPIRQIASRQFPNVPIIPTMSTGATDGIYTNAVGIPTYGFSAIFGNSDGNGMHGLNERVGVQQLMDGRRFQYELIKYYSTH